MYLAIDWLIAWFRTTFLTVVPTTYMYHIWLCTKNAFFDKKQQTRTHTVIWCVQENLKKKNLKLTLQAKHHLILFYFWSRNKSIYGAKRNSCGLHSFSYQHFWPHSNRIVLVRSLKRILVKRVFTV